MKIDLTTSGLFDARQFDAWSTERRNAIRSAVKRGMETGGREVRYAARSQMRSAFAVKGGTVSGNLLIPLLPNRIGPKRFKAVIEGLLRSGNAFFVKKDGKVILIAENIRENAAQLNRFKRAERGRTGAKQIKRGQEIPVAVLVKAVTLKRRLDLRGAVGRALPGLVGAIQKELAGA